MEKSKSASTQQCVTCTFWGGERSVTHWRDRVEYDSGNEYGECIGGGCNRQNKSAGFTCGSWQRWGALKG